MKNAIRCYRCIKAKVGRFNTSKGNHKNSFAHVSVTFTNIVLSLLRFRLKTIYSIIQNTINVFYILNRIFVSDLTEIK